jgi:hypothetical protein
MHAPIHPPSNAGFVRWLAMAVKMALEIAVVHEDNQRTWTAVWNIICPLAAAISATMRWKVALAVSCITLPLSLMFQRLPFLEKRIYTFDPSSVAATALAAFTCIYVGHVYGFYPFCGNIAVQVICYVEARLSFMFSLHARGACPRVCVFCFDYPSLWNEWRS